MLRARNDQNLAVKQFNTSGQLRLAAIATFLALSGILFTTRMGESAFAASWGNNLSSFNNVAVYEGRRPVVTTNGSVTVRAPGTLSGNVAYGNAIGAPSPRAVPDVLVNAPGSPPVYGKTDANGNYFLSGFGSGPYAVTPSKTNGVNGISAFDAAKISQWVAGSCNLTANQLYTADVSGNGLVSSYDAALVANYAAAASLSPVGLTGTWVFMRSHVDSLFDINGNATQDFSAILMGEVSGNWSNTGARGLDTAQSEKGVSVQAPKLVVPTDDDVVVPVTVNGVTDKEVISYEFNLRYDPTVILPRAHPVDLAGTVSRDLIVKANSHEPGLLKVAVYGPTPINADGLLLNLRFTAVGAAGWVSPLTFERIMFNEGAPGVLATEGQIELSAATTNRSEVTGRVLTAMGQVVSNAQVTLTDVMGLKRSTVTNGSGGYRFGNLELGQTYTIDARARELRFAPLAISVVNQITSIDIVAE